MFYGHRYDYGKSTFWHHVIKTSPSLYTPQNIDQVVIEEMVSAGILTESSHIALGVKNVFWSQILY